MLKPKYHQQGRIPIDNAQRRDYDRQNVHTREGHGQEDCSKKNAKSRGLVDQLEHREFVAGPNDVEQGKHAEQPPWIPKP
jgi:hypothetical protein